jgi:hypothetical protein
VNNPFSPLRWAERFRHATEQAAANGLTASGFSRRLAESCQLDLLRLYRELFTQFARCPVFPEDLTARPDLAAALTAVHAADKEGGAPC